MCIKSVLNLILTVPTFSAVKQPNKWFQDKTLNYFRMLNVPSNCSYYCPKFIFRLYIVYTRENNVKNIINFFGLFWNRACKKF